MISRTLIFTLYAVTLVSLSVRADSPDIRTLMTPEEYEAAGLEKLTQAELEALNHWLVRYTARDAPEVRRMNEVVQAEAAKADAEGIRSRVVGPFRGWSGETVFQLENGQIWKQRVPGRWFHRAESPDVVVRRNIMGYWELRVVAADRAIGVTRLK